MLNLLRLGVLLPGISEIKVEKFEEIEQLISKGNLRRTLAATAMNQFSSRSHAILQLRVEAREKAGYIYTLQLQCSLNNN